MLGPLSRRSFFGASLTAGLGAAAVAGGGSALAAGTGSRFTLGVLPDTQFYSRYSTEDTGDLYVERAGSEPFITQTRWLAEHADELGMPFVLHLGDVVDQATVAAEWDVADEAMAVLDDAGLPYAILPGNHDMATLEDGSSVFSRHFGEERAAAQATFLSAHIEPTQEGQAHLFEAEGQQYLVLALAWRAGVGTLAWAQSVLDAHPRLPAVLITHELLNIDAAGEVFLSTAYGQGLWDSFISRNNQIFLALGGHHHGAGVMVRTNEAGHDVVLVLQDYQMAYQGGNGLMGVLQLDLSAGEMTMTALSPWVAIKPAESLTQFDSVLLEGERDSWRVPFDFRARFSAIDPRWTPGDADDPDYAARARALVLEGWTAPSIEAGELPQDATDYPANEQTAAHWRPGQIRLAGTTPADGTVLPAGTVLPDVAHGQDMTRAALDTRGTRGALAEHVTFSTSHHELSADAGSVRFTGSDNRTDTRSWFVTAADAAVNGETFEDGYTFETFIRIDPAWSADTNAWMGAVSRDGRRGDLAADMPEGDEPPGTLAVSSLRELQWSAVATQGTTTGTSNWSHEVPADVWLHVVVINDPAAGTIEMLVDGAPILRDVIDAQGLASTGEPWLIGAAMWAGDPANGWLGWIGETRLTAAPLSPEQWLTARAPKEEAPVPGRPGTGHGRNRGRGKGHGKGHGRDRGRGKGHGRDRSHGKGYGRHRSRGKGHGRGRGHAPGQKKKH